jgi:hypothetical protein
MNIYFGIKFHADNKNRDWIESVVSHIVSQGHSVSCVVRDLEKWGEVRFDAKELMAKSFELIDQSDLVLIDLTEKGVGVGIEAGYAHAKKIPLITIAKTGSDISTTISGISGRVIFYAQASDILIQKV